MKLSERIPPHINIRNESNADWVNARNEVAQLEAENALLKKINEIVDITVYERALSEEEMTMVKEWVLRDALLTGEDDG